MHSSNNHHHHLHHRHPTTTIIIITASITIIILTLTTFNINIITTVISYGLFLLILIGWISLTSVVVSRGRPFLILSQNSSKYYSI